MGRPLVQIRAMQAMLQRGDLVPNIAKGYRPKEAVGPSRDLRRILALPSWQADPAEVAELSSLVTKPWSRMVLREVQGRALLAAQYALGLFAPVGVGHGKTLIAALLPTVLDRRALVLTSSSLVKQARRMTAEYQRHFLIRDDVTWLGYSMLSSASGSEIIDKLNPDLIIADECHNLRNKDAARTKRFLRFMKSKPQALFCALSGTITKRSILDFAHLLELALGERSPLPLHYPTLAEWAEALDVPKLGPPRPPGALREFGEPVRDGWNRRFVSVAGVVTTGHDDLGATLVLVPRPLALVPEVKASLERLRARWERPDGEQLTTAMEVARVERELRLGGHHKFVWQEDVPLVDRMEWLDCRRAWHKTLRGLLERFGHRAGRDSPMLMDRAVARGEFPDATEDWTKWHTVRRRVPAPASVWETVTDRPIEEIVARVREPMCIWTDTAPVGRKIAELGGWRYYGGGDDSILLVDGTKTIVASIQAHGTGRNLQCFSKAVVAGGGPTGLVWQQLLGRHHRQGQEADEVRFEILFPEELAAARKDAKYIESMTGEPQKLLLANVEGDEEDE